MCCAELGINVTQITQRMLSILNPLKMNTVLHEDPDLSGPFMFCMLFGLCQLLSGKVHFGVILGWTSVASLFLYMVYNLLAGRNGNLDLYRSVSLVGYSLVPLVLFSLVSAFIPGRYDACLQTPSNLFLSACLLSLKHYVILFGFLFQIISRKSHSSQESPQHCSEEPAVSYRWTHWVWEITGWSSRLQENDRSFQRNP